MRSSTGRRLSPNTPSLIFIFSKSVKHKQPAKVSLLCSNQNRGGFVCFNNPHKLAILRNQGLRYTHLNLHVFFLFTLRIQFLNTKTSAVAYIRTVKYRHFPGKLSQTLRNLTPQIPSLSIVAALETNLSGNPKNDLHPHGNTFLFSWEFSDTNNAGEHDDED